MTRILAIFFTDIFCQYTGIHVRKFYSLVRKKWDHYVMSDCIGRKIWVIFNVRLSLYKSLCNIKNMSMMKIIDFLICKVHMLSQVTEKCLFGLASLWHHQCWFHIIMCKIHTLYSIIYSTLYKVYGTQILYGHFDVLLFTYGVPLSCSNKDSSFQ